MTWVIGDIRPMPRTTCPDCRDGKHGCVGEAWDRTPHALELSTRFVVLCKDGSVKRFSLGAHTPDMSPADIDRIHKIWVEAVKAVGPEIHHRDVVTAALAALEHDLHSDRRQKAIEELRSQITHS